VLAVLELALLVRGKRLTKRIGDGASQFVRCLEGKEAQTRTIDGRPSSTRRPE
jgi:hypothetical protein